jgi:trehalose 6-phosphate phosphatase
MAASSDPSGDPSGDPTGGPADLLISLDRVAAVLAGGRVGLFLDIDGTLAPIQEDPFTVAIAPAVRDAIVTLSPWFRVVAISGRSVQSSYAIVGVDGITYVGDHGSQWLRDGVERFLPEAEPFVAEARRIAEAGQAALGHITGVIVEEKGTSVSLHYRATADRAAALRAIDDFIRDTPGVERFVRIEGKLIIDLRPAIDVDKGTALASLVSSEGMANVLVLGDDTTDIDAFVALRRLREAGQVGGLAIAVRSEGTKQGVLDAADYTLASVEAVEEFLTWLVAQTGD